jgi:hypothetical protein
VSEGIFVYKILTKTLNEVGWKSWGALAFIQQSAYGEMLTRKLEHEVTEVCVMEGGSVGGRKDENLCEVDGPF